MGTFVSIPIAQISTTTTRPSRTYRLDLETGHIRGMTDGIEAVRQFILKALITPRFKCLVYSNQYGSEIKDLIQAKDASPELIVAEIPRLVKDALAGDKRIIEIFDFEFTFRHDSAHIKFGVDTIFGSTVMEVVI